MTKKQTNYASKHLMQRIIRLKMQIPLTHKNILNVKVSMREFSG